MTLAELLPSLRSTLRPHLDPELWPSTARWGAHGDLLIGGVRVSVLAPTYGTPVHVLDEADVRARCAGYRAAFPDGVAYSAKAGLTMGQGRWIAAAGLGCYTGSGAQLRTALLAGFRPARLVLVGAAKSVHDLDAAFACGAAVVAGTAAEVRALTARAPLGQRVHLRVVPSAAGPGRCRYGFRLGTGVALEAVGEVLASRNLRLAGLDFSLGHQLSRFQTFESTLREAVAFCAVVRARTGVVVDALNLGGGHAVAYTDHDHGFALQPFANRIRAMLRLAAERHAVPAPALTVSPGRAIVARSGVTVHRVAEVRTASDGRLTVVLDGVAPDCAPHRRTPGRRECPGRHTAQLVGRVSQAPMRLAAVVGDTDVLVPAMQVPGDVTAGDLLVVAGTGAYHHRRDHFVGRPPVVSVADGAARTLVRREGVDDLLGILSGHPVGTR
ncbi:diaminopimelate decarboxylase family protein [Actinoplanes sp. NPDC051494]|uniref:diaminopimelate decarboxylase family protein n=1 Tax=Actinoplanes sp. NPDC051494 TaxID=3363907 RepID=UPI0037B954B1